MSKHLINKQEDWANDAIKGYLLAHNNDLIALADYPKVVIRKDYLSLEETNSRVALISGGGSGHEPAHLGFVGQGMLTAAVCGDLFASPSTASILAAIRFVGAHNKAGVLLIVKNYTGDRLNFGLAAKRAQLEGINVDMVLVDDDWALEKDDHSSVVGRRGLCGTVFIHKIAGAMAEQRRSLKEIKETIESIVKNNRLRTIGVSLSGRVGLPGEDASKAVSIGANEIEIGLGIHGEAGRKRVEMKKSRELVDAILSEIDLFQSQRVCLMVNNLGGLSNLELFLLFNDINDYLATKRRDIQVKRVYCGTLMTSLNMNGFSLTALSLGDDENELLSLLDASTNAPGWPRKYGSDVAEFQYTEQSTSSTLSTQRGLEKANFVKFASPKTSEWFKSTLIAISDDLISIKNLLNDLDAKAGDGDCGNSLARIGQTVLDEIQANKFDFDYPHQVVNELSKILENGGGSLCIILSLFFSSAVRSFEKASHGSISSLEWVKLWQNVVENGLNAVQEYGQAKPNQRSIVDPLTAINSYLKEFLAGNSAELTNDQLSDLLKNLVNKTHDSAESTAHMKPRVGRASYVDSTIINTPDAGAKGISSIVNSIYKAYLLSQ